MTLRDMRVDKGLSSSYMAKNLSISQRQFNRLEAGETKLTKERIKIMSKIYRVKMSEITEVIK